MRGMNIIAAGVMGIGSRPQKTRSDNNDIRKAIEIVKENCYVFNPLNFDLTTLINSALDMVINTAKVNIKEVRKIESKN